MVCASSSRRAETTFFSCLGSTFGIRAISSSPLLLLIQSRCALCLQLCRRRSEEICWTTWAVATPGAEGAGRLSSRSKWGRYRPKNGFLLRPFLRPVPGYLGSFLPPRGHHHRKTGRKSSPQTQVACLDVPKG